MYRYRLDRHISMLCGPLVAFCLHNPSTADATKDDPTLRRGIGFATAWGASRLVFINSWAGRATKPRDLWQLADPVGPENDNHIRAVAVEVAETRGVIVAAWGNVSPPAALREAVCGRLAYVEALIRSTGCVLTALAVNDRGAPKHPLYVRRDARPVPWRFVAPLQ